MLTQAFSKTSLAAERKMDGRGDRVNVGGSVLLLWD